MTGPLVVCCRLHDYEMWQEKLKLGQTIVLKKLTQQLVTHYFERLQTRQPQAKEQLTDLSQRILQDDTLRELTETPLMLNIITATYIFPHAPPLPEGQNIDLRTEIFRAYSARMFERMGRTQIKLHPNETIIHYLGYLATQLQTHNLTQFSIGQIRSSWLPIGLIRRQYHLLSGFIFGVLFGMRVGLSVGLIGGVLFGMRVGLISGLIVGLIGMLHSGLIFRLSGDQQDKEPIESLRWNWSPAIKGLRVGIINGLRIGLILGLIGAILFGVPYGVIGLIGGLISGLLFGLIFGLLVGLLIGLIGGLLFGLHGETINHKVEPDQEIRRSQSSVLIVGLLFGLLYGLVGELFGGLLIGLIFGLFIGPTVGLRYGGIFLIQHYLRLTLLNKHNLLPFNLLPFLNQATELIFLQRIGGSYRFIHRSVQEYFAEQWEANGHMMEVTHEQESNV